MDDQILTQLMFVAVGLVNAAVVGGVGLVVRSFKQSVRDLEKDLGDTVSDHDRRIVQLERNNDRDEERHNTVMAMLESIGRRLDAMQTQRDSDFRDAHSG